MRLFLFKKENLNFLFIFGRNEEGRCVIIRYIALLFNILSKFVSKNASVVKNAFTYSLGFDKIYIGGAAFAL